MGNGAGFLSSSIRDTTEMESAHGKNRKNLSAPLRWGDAHRQGPGAVPIPHRSHSPPPAACGATRLVVFDRRTFRRFRRDWAVKVTYRPPRATITMLNRRLHDLAGSHQGGSRRWASRRSNL